MQILFIGRLNTEPTEAVLKLVKAEAESVWQLYAADKVHSFHYLADMSGAVMMLNVQDLAEAEAIASELPLVQAGFLDVQLLPLKPYTGIESLFSN
ncbi:MAG: hypothetical protein AAF921_04190 [Cyanobacteria bacterium P01_D01_bin.44]